jgi:peroxiredoxin
MSPARDNPEICSMKICFRFILLMSLCIATPAFALLEAGTPAPDFNARTLDGQPTNLGRYKGKTLLVELGTTWCPSCNEQARQIDGIRDFLTQRNITYISVFLADSAESIQEKLKTEGHKRPDQIMLDSGEARRSYNVFSIPRIILIDKDFKIVFDEMILDKKQLKQRINNHLNQQ